MNVNKKSKGRVYRRDKSNVNTNVLQSFSIRSTMAFPPHELI